MFSPFDDYLVNLKLAEAREMWDRAERLKRELGGDRPHTRARPRIRSRLQWLVDELALGGFGRSDPAGDALDGSIREWGAD